MANVPKVKFYLESSAQGKSRRIGMSPTEMKEVDNKPQSIFIYIRFRSKTIKASTGRKCKRTSWDLKKQRINPRRDRHYLLLNLFLDNLSFEVGVLFDKAIQNTRFPEKGEVIDIINKLNGGEIQIENEDNDFSVQGLLNKFIDSKKSFVKPITLQRYTALRKHIGEFKQNKIYLEYLDRKFYNEFLIFLFQTKKIQNSTAGKLIIGLKSFLKWCSEQGHNPPLDYKKFKVPKQQANIISLSSNEFNSMLKLDLENDKRLERIRDVFCFACLTGLRFSDILRLEKSNFRKNEIHITTQKTRDVLLIPLIEEAVSIAKKYNYKLPDISNQKMNEYLKDLGKKTELNNEISISEFRGPVETKKSFKKWELLSFHTARKTFVTLSLEFGMRPETVMNITGHKDFRTMKPYIRIAKKAKEEEMKNAWDKITS